MVLIVILRPGTSAKLLMEFLKIFDIRAVRKNAHFVDLFSRFLSKRVHLVDLGKIHGTLLKNAATLAIRSVNTAENQPSEASSKLVVHNGSVLTASTSKCR